MITRTIFTSILLLAISTSLAASNNQAMEPIDTQASGNTAFIPDITITQQTAADHHLLQTTRPLMYEPDETLNPRFDVYKKAIQEYNGQEVVLLTHDEVRISALYFKRPSAVINIIYIPGYFFDLTPPKEWAVPFAAIFPEFNILSIDWRGFGHSDGASGLLTKNSFGSNAYPDIQAAVDFIRKENKKPTILVGFCFGAAMILHATNQAKKTGANTADALVLNGIFSTFEKQFNRAIDLDNRIFYSLLLQSGLAKIILEWQSDGSLFELNPIESIKGVTIPCYFEHYTHDRFSSLEGSIEVFNAATCPKMFMQSNIGWHVRIHNKVPFGYREAFLVFLKHFGFLGSNDGEQQKR